MGKWVSDMGARGAGTLAAYRSGGGKTSRVLFYFRYTQPDGTRYALPLGGWDGTGGTLSLKAARSKANELSARYIRGDRDLKAALEAEEAEKRRQIEATRKAEEDARERAQATLGALLIAYAASLRVKGKSSARDVETAVIRHIQSPWPSAWNSPADELSTDDLLELLVALTDEGKLREAAKLRSYLLAAYNAGMKARTAASSTPELRLLRIRTNPARDLGTIEGSSKARDRALSEGELRAYWKRIDSDQHPERSCLRFHLLTGGQRIAQLGRATLTDYDPDQATLMLQDPKGRRATPRAHLAPLLPEALAAMEAMAPERLGPFVFTTTAGRVGMDGATAYKRCNVVMQEMMEAGELPGGEFSLTDIRRTVETRLSALGIHSDVRAQLQSHGLGGVQNRYYDRHDYLQEKRDALESLLRMMTTDQAKVVNIRRDAIRKKA